MAPKHIRVLLPRNTQADHDVEEVGGSVLANVYNNKNFTALPVDQPMLQAALSDFTASIAATVQGEKAVAYELYFASVGNDGAIGEWKHVVTVTSPRQIPVDDLKPGSTYAFKARAVGGTNGYGDFSDPVTHMSL